MGRPRRNKLSLELGPDRLWHLSGYFQGERIRRRSIDRAELEEMRESMLGKLAEGNTRQRHLILTHLTEAQVRDAEAAIARAPVGRSLLACVEAADRVLVDGEPVSLVDAHAEWVSDLTKRGRYDSTVKKNKLRAQAFIAWLKVAGVLTVQGVCAEHCEGFVFRAGNDGGARADYTRTTDASVVRAWCSYWVRRRWIKTSPFELDFDDLAERARAKELPRILTPAKMHDLLARAKAEKKAPGLAAYVALAGWCFLRHAEVLRLTADDIKLDRKTPIVEVRPRKRGTVSYRAVDIPACVLPILRHAKEAGIGPECPRVIWERVRSEAGVFATWQENILRHTGISYFYQKTGDVKETCRQAGNSSDTAFAHYLNLPAEGAADAFYECA